MKQKAWLGLVVTAFVLSAGIPLFAQEQARPDALRSYRIGRDLEARNRIAEANASYQEAIAICQQDLAANARNMDAYTIYCWSLVRLNRHQEAVNIGTRALAVRNDPRIVESMGEAYFYLDNYRDSLRNMESYTDTAPRGERVSTAYFFMAEIYRLTRRYNLAEFAYTAAVFYEPALPLWWYRLGTVREEIGDHSGAVDAYNRALRLRPDYPEASDGLRRVQNRSNT